MPGRILLDTNVIIAFFAGQKAVSQHVSQSELFVSSIVLGELHYGACKAAHAAANQARIEEFASSVSVLNCDAETARRYGQIKDHLRLKGRPIPENDIWIAACAMQYGLPLARATITSDTRALIYPLFQNHSHGVTHVFPDRFAYLSLHRQLTRPIAHRHKRTPKRMTIDLSPDFHQPTRPKKLD